MVEAVSSQNTPEQGGPLLLVVWNTKGWGDFSTVPTFWKHRA